MRFIHNDVNFDVTYEGNNNCLKIFLWTFCRLFITRFRLTTHIIFDLQAIHNTHSDPSKKLTIFQFTRKPSITNILKRCLLVEQEVLYKSPIDITPLSLTLHAVNRQFIYQLKNCKLWCVGWNTLIDFL